MLAVGLVVVTTGIGKLITNIPIVDPTSMDMLYILSVVVSSAYLGLGPSLMISVLGVLAFDFFFILPLYSLTISNEKEIITILILFVACIVISFLYPQTRT